MSSFELIGSGLYRVNGRVKTHVLKRNDTALVVDPGPGSWPEHLKEIGVWRVAAVLATHHHRDTLHHAAKLVAQGAKLAAPATEAHLIEGAAEFWRTARTFILYDCDSDFFSLRESVPVALNLSDGQETDLEGWRVKAVELQGHTQGSMAYVVAHGGKRLAFMGDNLAVPGTVHDLHDFHYDYMGFGQGAGLLAERLPKLRAEKPELLLPAHGDPVAEVEPALELLERNLRQHVEILAPKRIPRPRDEIRQVSPHVYFVGLTTYALIGDDGRALIWDWGYNNTDRLHRLAAEHGLKQVDVLTFSHYHEDHLNRAVEVAHHIAPSGGKSTRHPRGAEIWCHRMLHDILTRPHAWRLPCVWPQPIPIDRVFGDETIEWNGFKLEFFEFPGQTYYHVGMLAHADGHRFAFTGDNIWKPQPGQRIHGPIIPRNRYFTARGHAYCAEQLIARKADFICPGHNDAYPVTREDLEGYRAWAEDAHASIRALCPAEPLGYDPWWLRFDPFHIYLHADEPAEANVVIESPFPRTVRLTLRPVCDAALSVTPAEATLDVEARGTARAAFAFRAARPLPVGARIPICVDLYVDGEAWGEIGEGLAVVRP